MNLNKLTKLSELFSFAISVDEIKRKPKGQISTQEEWENIINQLSSVENNPNNQLTILYALEISKGKETLNSAIEKIKKLTEKKSVSLQDQLKQKYKSDVIEIEKNLNNHGKKYLVIACKWILEDKNNLTDVCQTLNIFDSVSINLSHKSPDKYNSYEDLHLEISNIPDKEIVDLNVDLPFLGSTGSYKVYRIENQSQGMKIGQEIEDAIGWKNIQEKVGGSGRWCITWTQNNYYNTYSAQNQYFYFVDDLSQDWNDNYDKLKCCVVHYVKDFEGNIKQKHVTTLANGKPDNISSYSKLAAAVDNIITKDVEKQPERVLSKLKRGAASQKEFNTFVVNYHMNPNPEVIEQEKDGLKSFLNQVGDKYFNKSLYNIVRSGNTEEYKVFLKVLIKNTKDYELLNSLPEDLLIKAIKHRPYIIKHIKNPSEELKSIAVNHEPRVITSIPNASEELKLKAVRKMFSVITAIDNPSEAVQLEAVSTYIESDKRKDDRDTEDFDFNSGNFDLNKFFACINSESAQLKAFKYNPRIKKYIKNPSEFIQLELLIDNLDNFNLIKNPTQKVIDYYKSMSEILKNPYNIIDVENPSEKMQFEALFIDINVFPYIKNPTQKVIDYYKDRKSLTLRLVEEDPYYIRDVENPSEEVQLAALKGDDYVFRWIKNPTQKVIDFYNKIKVIKDDSEFPVVSSIINPSVIEIYGQSLKTEKMSKAYLKVFKF
jgi:hypothetical protein